MNQLTTYYAPPSIVDDPQPNLEYIEFEFIWGVLISGNASQTALYEDSFGMVHEIKLCSEGTSWKSPN